MSALYWLRSRLPLRHRRGWGVTLLLVVLGATALPGCAPGIEGGAPACDAGTRLAIVAQSVPEAAYVPCIQDLRPGWRTASFDAERGRTRFSLISDRAAANPVKVALVPKCDVAGATPATARAEGVRTYLRVATIAPRFTGTLYDVFPGGCVTYGFDFERGRHITLTEDFEAAVGLVSRRELRLRVDRELGVELDR